MRPVLLLLVVLCAACAPSQPSPVNSPAPTPAPIIIVTDGATPMLVPTATLTPTALGNQRCTGAPPVRLIVSERGRVTRNNERLNLRAGPGTEYDVLTLLNQGYVFFVLDGPACSGGFTWFQVRARGRTGWLAEGDAQQYYVEPHLAG